MQKRPAKGVGAKKVIKPPKLSKRSLALTLIAELKAGSGRKDIKFEKAAGFASNTAKNIKLGDRAGFPLKLAKKTVHPSQWHTKDGKKVEVDFGRTAWLPDDWGQGVKATSPSARSSANGSGGTLACFVSPDGQTVYYHKGNVEKYVGRKLGESDGFNGQIKLAKVQAAQNVQLARAQVKTQGSTGSYIGSDSDAAFFKLLTPQERKHLPSKEEFHFSVVSARRAKEINGVRDIFAVQGQFLDSGVSPTWYVDQQSFKDYKALGLKTKVGGALTAARNMALDDAARAGKICVQSSDDISCWEYRNGKVISIRSDDAMNAAHAKADRYVVSPVAAARFIAAKMRSAEAPQPKLGGVYPLGSCSRTWGGPPFARKHFTIGDFFVTDKGSKVRFDEEMKLKEDYDYTASHIAAHGSVMRCQRMTLNVKHYSNSGGAVSTRDKKGKEEQRNIAILHKKWPGQFRKHPKRKNEVILAWKDGKKLAANAVDDDFEEAATPRTPRTPKVTKTIKKSMKHKRQ